VITVFGSINVDLVTRVPVLPRPGETVLAASYETLFGGKGANQAVAAARAARDRVTVRMVGAVGHDGFGRDCIANLRHEAIDISAIVTVDAPTGCAFIQVNDAGENVITVASGANRLLTAEPMQPLSSGSGHLLVVQMEVPPEASIAVARSARGTGGRIITNLAPVPPGLSADLLREICAVTDVLVVNQHEACAAAACLGLATFDGTEAAVFMAAQVACTVIATLGAQGAVAAVPDGHLLRARSGSIIPVDTTGAGDTFVGVLAAAMAEGLELQPAMQRACKAASLACLSLGAQSSMPHREAIFG
jgi:ribokinase